MAISHWWQRTLSLGLAYRVRRKLLPLDDDSRPIVWFDLHSASMLFDGARHFHSLAMQLMDLGHPLVLIDRNGIPDQLACKQHGRSLLRVPNLFIASAPSSFPSGSVVFSDLQMSKQSHLAIRVSVSDCPVSGACVFPFPVHPTVRPHMTPAMLARGRAMNHRARVFFCSNQKPYDSNSGIALPFEVCNRLELAAHLRHAFGGLCSTLDRWPKTKESVWSPIMLGDSRKNFIKPEYWFEALSHFDFCIGSPATTQPMCHPFIEAMSVGTIPILEYANRFSPSLIDGENAIVFSGIEGFDQAIRRVLSMSDSEIQRLRRNVIHYFETHLQSEKFVRRLLMRAKICGGAVLSIPYHDRNLDPPPQRGDCSPPIDARGLQRRSA